MERSNGETPAADTVPSRISSVPPVPALARPPCPSPPIGVYSIFRYAAFPNRRRKSREGRKNDPDLAFHHDRWIERGVVRSAIPACRLSASKRVNRQIARSFDRHRPLRAGVRSEEHTS